MSVTKNSLINSVHDNLNIPNSESGKLVESIIEIIKKTLASGEDVLISRFGKFCVLNKRERRGRNPATGADLILGKRRVVTFKCSPVLRDQVNVK